MPINPIAMRIVSHAPMFWFKMKFSRSSLLLLYVYFLLEATSAEANVILRTDPSTTVEGSGDIRFHEEDSRASALEYVMVWTVLAVLAVGFCLFLYFCYNCQCTCRRDVPESTPLIELAQLYG